MINRRTTLQTEKEAKERENVAFSEPNAETVAAMAEAEKISTDESVAGYSNMNKMFSDLEKDEEEEFGL